MIYYTSTIFLPSLGSEDRYIFQLNMLYPSDHTAETKPSSTFVGF